MLPSQVHIVYDSRVSGDRSESPEHSGIPAIPVPVFSSRVRPGRERGYTSDESREGEEPARRQRGGRKERIVWA